MSHCLNLIKTVTKLNSLNNGFWKEIWSEHFKIVNV